MTSLRPFPDHPLNWLQGGRGRLVDWSQPWSFYNVGDVDQGKMGADIAEFMNYLAESKYYKGADVFGSDNDSESLIHFKGPYKDETAAIVDDSWTGEIPFPTIRVSDFSLEAMAGYRIVVTDKVLYRNQAVHESALSRIFQVFRDRRGYKQELGQPIIALIVREARKVVMAQAKSFMSEDKKEAEYVFADMNAQRAHSGIAPIVDNQRWMGVNIDYRDIAAYKVLKGFGPQVIPKELRWVFKGRVALKWLITPLKTIRSWPTQLRNMPVREFVCLDKWSGISHGVIEEIDYLRYKGYDLADILGVRPEFSKAAEEPKQKTLSTHAKEMLELHKRVREMEGHGLNAKDIAAQLEIETGRRMTAPGVYYHMTPGRCSCEGKEE